MKKYWLLLIIFLVIICCGVFMFFYYVKPQREFIKLKTQSCIDEAMSPINKEIQNSLYGTGSYKNDVELKRMLQTQHEAILKCVLNYNTILFSSPEKKFVESKLDSTLKNQKIGIDDYRKRVLDYIINQKTKAEQNAQENKKQADCKEKESLYNKYNKCVEDMKENGSNSMTAIDRLLLDQTTLNDRRNFCLNKYNFESVDADSFVCIMMGIFVP